MTDTSLSSTLTYTVKDCPPLLGVNDVSIVSYGWRYRKSVTVLPMSTIVMLLGPTYGPFVGGIWLASVIWYTRVQYALLLFHAQSDDAVLLSLEADGCSLLQAASEHTARRRAILRRLKQTPEARDWRKAWETHVATEWALARRQRECLHSLVLKYRGSHH